MSGNQPGSGMEYGQRKFRLNNQKMAVAKAQQFNKDLLAKIAALEARVLELEKKVNEK